MSPKDVKMLDDFKKDVEDSRGQLGSYFGAVDEAIKTYKADYDISAFNLTQDKNQNLKIEVRLLLSMPRQWLITLQHSW